MSDIKNNLVAVELTETELEHVAGGLNIAIGDATGLAQSAANDFFKKSVSVAQKTIAGPDGSGTVSAISLEQIASSAAQGITVS